MRTHVITAIGLLAMAAQAQAGAVSISFEDDPLTPQGASLLPAPEYTRAPYFIEFDAITSSNLFATSAHFGEEEPSASTAGGVTMRAVDGFVFSDFRFDLTLGASAGPRTVTIEVATGDRGAEVFRQITLDQGVATDWELTPEILRTQGWDDITLVRILDTEGAFEVDNISYGAQVVPLPGPAGLAAAGLTALIGLQRRRARTV